jgi:hypothetical protein
MNKIKIKKKKKDISCPLLCLSSSSDSSAETDHQVTRKTPGCRGKTQGGEME